MLTHSTQPQPQLVPSAPHHLALIRPCCTATLPCLVPQLLHTRPLAGHHPLFDHTHVVPNPSVSCSYSLRNIALGIYTQPILPTCDPLCTSAQSTMLVPCGHLCGWRKAHSLVAHCSSIPHLDHAKRYVIRFSYTHMH